MQVIRAQLYEMIEGMRQLFVVLSPASFVDKTGDPAFRLLPYEYGPVYVINVLKEIWEMDRVAGTVFQ